MSNPLDRPSPTVPVILLPGAVLPAQQAYEALLESLGPNVDARVKDLELYAGDDPPRDYSLATEVAGIDRVREASSADHMHLVGYSAGGAACLAYAAAQPERVRSLALMEPAFAGWQGMSPEERGHMERFRELQGVTDGDMLGPFQALQLAPDVQPPSPPPGPPPAWLSRRPAGIRALLHSFFQTDLELSLLGRVTSPVWIAVGGRSHPDFFARMAERLSRSFPNCTIEVFPARHHFDPPHRVEPDAVAERLRDLWARAASHRPD